MKKKKIILLLLLIIPVFSFFISTTFSKYISKLSNAISITYSRPHYTVKFNSNGGTGTMSDMNITRAVSQTLTANAYTKSGYDFIGWNTAADGSGNSYADEEEIAYASITDGDVITLYAQWFDDSYLDDTTELKNYTCEEEVKSFSAPYTGKYVLEVWGAQGGSVSTNTGTKGTVQAVEGGKGGYSYEIVNLNAGDTVYVAVGCQGKTIENSPDGTTKPGGYNGGGIALVDSTVNYSGSGGGATHFANSNLGELKNYSENQSDVLLVAGGGGGSYNSTDILYYSYGGAGGGLTGGDSVSFHNSNSNSMYRKTNGFVYYQGLRIPGANQTLQIGTDYSYGTFGKGVDAITDISGTDSGAGGGWYGGNRLIKPNTGGGMAASGGSGHVNTTDSKYVEGKTIAGNLQIPNHNGTAYMTGNDGDGYARVSFVNPKYKIKFNSNGGTGTMADQNFVYGTAQNLTSNTFTRTNYVFDSWNTEPDGSGDSYANGAEVNNLTLTDGDEITLYAQWTPPKIYFQLPPDWSGNKVYAYLYSSTNSSVVNGAWTASTSLMTLKDSSKNIYQYEFSSATDTSNLSSYDKLIFANDDAFTDSDSKARRSVIVDFSTNDLGKVFVPELYNSTTEMRMFGYASTLYLYTWNSSSGSTNGTWPGIQMQNDLVDGMRTHVQKVNISTYNRMILNQGSGQNQTEDITIPKRFTFNSNSIIAQDLTFKITGIYIKASCPNGSDCSNSDKHKFYSMFTRYAYYGSWHDYSTWDSTDYTTWNTTGDGAKFRAAQAALGY